MIDEDLVIYSLPVSGSLFVVQIGLLGILHDAKKKNRNGKFKSYKDYTPDICLAGSGGNICAYIALAANYSPEGMMRIALTLNSDIFIKSWFPDYMSFLPTAILGIFNGSLYRPGHGAGCTFNRYFSTKTIQSVEIWTGTYNVTTNRAEFFCNKSQENALIQQSFFESDQDIYDVMRLRYLSDEPDIINKLAKVAIASASIPYVVKPIEIDGQIYADAGIMYSSTSLPLSNEIYRLVKGHKYESEYCMDGDGKVSKETDIIKPRRLRHFYFSPYDTYSKEMVIASRTLHGPIAQILHTNLLQDKASAISNLQRIYGIESSQLIHEHYIDADKDTLCTVLKKLEKYEHYFCDLYPKGIIKVPLCGFTKSHIEEKINAVTDNFAIQIWYYSP